MKKRSYSIFFWIKALLLTLGSFFLILCILAFTTVPFWAYYRLSGAFDTRHATEAIVLLSGAGIPSESGLMRTYYTAELAALNPTARVVVAVPGKLSEKDSDPNRVLRELQLRGVDSSRIIYANTGRNTRTQALEVASLLQGTAVADDITLVTSPEHIKRAVLSFKKCGFKQVHGMAAFESSLSTDLRFDDKPEKGKQLLPPIGRQLHLRYQFWNHLKLEIIVIREYFALTYYRLRGWI
ncbi:MAG: YdcF family protein [Lentimicrobiaceae bacterium]|nr:YdcF family protein [Lentimicrobiaceae bacterium]